MIKKKNQEVTVDTKSKPNSPKSVVWWGKGDNFHEEKKNVHGFQVFLPKLPRRKNIFEVREEKTLQKSVEEKTPRKSRGKIFSTFRGEKTYSTLQGK